MDLWERMIARADQDNLPETHPLRLTAHELNDATTGYFAPKQTKTVRQFVGSWARARRIWCEHTGESLL